MTVTTRFAPSPTGTLHVGNVRTALHNWLLAKQAGGRFLLRIDDTDAERSREEYVEAIKADLTWLGLHWDGEERQSARFGLYEAEFAKLVAAGVSPSQSRSAMIAATCSSRLRSASVSSIRSRNRPPAFALSR